MVKKIIETSEEKKNRIIAEKEKRRLENQNKLFLHLNKNNQEHQEEISRDFEKSSESLEEKNDQDSKKECIDNFQQYNEVENLIVNQEIDNNNVFEEEQNKVLTEEEKKEMEKQLNRIKELEAQLEALKKGKKKRPVQVSSFVSEFTKNSVDCMHLKEFSEDDRKKKADIFEIAIEDYRLKYHPSLEIKKIES
jgi:hypothetical protein